MELCQALLYEQQLLDNDVIELNDSLEVTQDRHLADTNDHFLLVVDTTAAFEQSHDVKTLTTATNTPPELRTFTWFEAILLILCLTGIIGNLLNLLVLTKRRFRTTLGNLESSANYGLVSLALSDLAFCAVVLPHAFLPGISGYYDGYTRGPWLLAYKLYGVASINLLQMTSTWIVIIIAINRWIVVTFPFQAKAWIDRRLTIISIIGVCVASIVLTLPYYIRLKIAHCRNHAGDVMYELTQAWDVDVQRDVQFYLKWIWPIVANFIPLLILMICNVQLIMRVKHTHQERMDVGRRVSSNKCTESKVTVTLLSIVFMYLLFVTPAEIIRYVNPYAAWGETGIVVAKCFNLSITLNFAFNFLLYCIVNATFRQTAREILRPKKRHVTTSVKQQLQGHERYMRVNSHQRSSSKTEASTL